MGCEAGVSWQPIGHSRDWLVETGSEERDEFASICNRSQEDVEATGEAGRAAGLSGLAPIVVERAAQLREQAEAMRAGNVRLLLNELAVYKGQYTSLQTELAAARAQP